MTKEKLKQLWDSDPRKVTIEIINHCAIQWGISNKPDYLPPQKVEELVFKAANILQSR